MLKTLYCKTEKSARDTVRLYKKFGHEVSEIIHDNERDCYAVQVSDKSNNPELEVMEKKWWDAINAEKYLRREWKSIVPPTFKSKYTGNLAIRIVLVILTALMFFVSTLLSDAAHTIANNPAQVDEFFAGQDNGQGWYIEVIQRDESVDPPKTGVEKVPINSSISVPIAKMTISGFIWGGICTITGSDTFDYDTLRLFCEQMHSICIMAASVFLILWLIILMNVFASYNQEKGIALRRGELFVGIREKFEKDKEEILKYLNAD